MSDSPSPVDIGEPISPDDTAPAPQIPDHRNTATRTPPTSPPTAPITTHSGDPPDDSRRCFICLEDESDLAIISADWVTPCSQCHLEGHQTCLLTWVADLETQGKDVKCPVCKTRIDVLDRWDPTVQFGDTLNRFLSALSPPLLLGFGLSGAGMSSAVYGMHALEIFAGPEAALRYLFRKPEQKDYVEMALGRLSDALPSLIPRTPASTRSMLMQQGIPTGPPIDWLHFLSLTLIAPGLVLNRMHLGQAVLIPTSLMYAMFLSDHRTDMLVWPPSPQNALAAFPAVKAIYFHLYYAVSKTVEKRLETLTTRSLNLQGENARQEPPLPEQAEDNIEIQFNLRLGDDEDENPPGDGAQNDNPMVARPNRPGTSLGSLVNYLAGALLWPSVSYGSGSLLRLILPAAWVNKPLSGPPTGLLQERWGRSLVGGCLFVLLKDAFFLYIKWRKAINRPYRRIRNVDRRARVN